jgi:hypothetical protein
MVNFIGQPLCFLGEIPPERVGRGGGECSARIQGSLDSVEERAVVTPLGVELRTYDSAVCAVCILLITVRKLSFNHHFQRLYILMGTRYYLTMQIR